MEEVPGCISLAPLACPCFLLQVCFYRSLDRRALRLPGKDGDDFNCALEPLPGYFPCRTNCHPAFLTEWHYRQTNNFQINSHFIADAYTDETFVEVQFSWQVQIQLFSCCQDGVASQTKTISDIILNVLFRSRCRFREIRFLMFFLTTNLNK